MNLQIEPATPRDLGALLQWRMEVLHAVFSIPIDTPLDALREANRRYYETELPRGGHLACFARLDGVAGRLRRRVLLPRDALAG